MTTRYTVECSECRFVFVTHVNEQVAQNEAKKHEQQSNHRGPFVWKIQEEQLPVRGLKEAAIKHADERAEREGRRMWVYQRGTVFFVRSYDEGVPINAENVYSTPPTKEEL